MNRKYKTFIFLLLSIILLLELLFIIHLDDYEKKDLDIRISGFDFEEDIIGKKPSGWSITESGSSYVRVVENIGGREGKMVECYFDGSNNYLVTDMLINGIISGSANWWVRIDNTSALNSAEAFSDPNPSDAILIILGDFGGQGSGIYDGQTGTKLYSISINVWYQLKVDFNSNTDTYNLYIRTDKSNPYIQIGNNLNYLLDVNSVKYFSFSSLGIFGSSIHKLWFDDVNYSWNPIRDITYTPIPKPKEGSDSLNIEVSINSENNEIIEDNEYKITWESNYKFYYVDIILYKDNQFVEYIAFDLYNSGYFNWKVENLDEGNYTIGIYDFVNKEMGLSKEQQLTKERIILPDFSFLLIGLILIISITFIIVYIKRKNILRIAIK
ncbi:MAG: hypothetical protein ACFFG0_42670 [Candidatus Thorarchaeota archaeon]